MFQEITNGISEFFSDNLFSDFSVTCFLKGVGEGLLFGLGTLALIALAPAEIAIVIALGLLVLGAAGLATLAHEWPNMTGAQKSQAIGGIVGGIIAGKFGPPALPPPEFAIPSFVLVPSRTGALALAPSMTIVSGASFMSVIGATAGGGGAGFLSSSSSSEPPPKQEPKTTDGNFEDPDLESSYQKYVKRKLRLGEQARDRDSWKQSSDYWKNESPMARGNRYNQTVRDRGTYPYSEVNLSDGTRLDSYVPEEEIISRKATDFDEIDPGTFAEYLNEVKTKYPAGKTIRSNAYPTLDGEPLSGKPVLEVPDTNLTAKNRVSFEQMARDKGITVRYTPE